ncbi:hypothetical protein B0T24DRAFT_524400, partial [Lasiosphaeria ovina]
SPETRGTLAILWSCLVTLVACIYTALHLNIPVVSGTWNRFLQKAKWTVIALFAPELVLYIASDQFFQARRFQRDMKVLLQERGYREGDPDESTYSLKFCFFVVMGGFQASIEDIYPSPGAMGVWMKPLDTLCSLSTLGILQLARTGHFVTISEAEIDDKSKADIIQKFLVVTQVTWMAVQCAFRAAWGLPISLLEIHTLVHVVCALAMYIFWFRKLANIGEPKVVDTEPFQDALALMVQEQLCHSQNYATVLYPSDSGRNHSDISVNIHKGNTERLPCGWGLPNLGIYLQTEVAFPGSRALLSSLLDSIRSEDCSQTIPAEEKAFTLDILTRLRSAGKAVQNLGLDISAIRRISNVINSMPNGDQFQELNVLFSLARDSALKKLSPQDMIRAERVVNMIQEIDKGPIQHPQLYLNNSTVWRYPELKYNESLHHNSHVSVGPGMFALLETQQDGVLSHFLLAILLPVLYGGVHLTALRYEFATDIESRLWMISCCVIMSAFLPTSLISWFLGKLENLSPTFEDIGIKYWLMGLVFLAYIFSRVFIIVESFLSIRSLPVGVYWMPSWLQVVPHL